MKKLQHCLNLALNLVLVISIIAALTVGLHRYLIEREYRYIDLTIDFEDLKKTVGAWDIEEALMILKSNGLTSVAVHEVTLESLRQEGKISVFGGGELLAERRLSGININPSYTYIFTNDSKVFDHLNYELTARFTGDRVEVLATDNSYLLVVKHPATRTLLEMEMGFNMDDFDFVKSLGLNIIPRVRNNPHFNSSYIDNLFQCFKEYPVSALIFVGDEVLGFPENLDVTAAYLKQFDIPFGLIESLTGSSPNLKQAGMEHLAKKTDYKATRVFSLQEREIRALEPKEIIDKWVRSTERNNRILYLRTITRPYNFPEENIALTAQALGELKERLEKLGYERGKVIPLTPFRANKIILLIISAGATAGGVLLLRELFPISETAQGAIYLTLFLIIALLLFTPLWILDVLMVALAGSIIFPSLAIVSVLRELDGNRAALKHIVMLYAKTIIITMIGALFIAAVLADIRFFLKLDSFRGVKLAFIAPLLLVGMYYIGNYGLENKYKNNQGYSGYIKNITELFNLQIQVKHLVLLAFAGAVVTIYLLRSGNLPGIGVSGLEMEIRAFLEDAFIARPRTKEFLIGHPMLILLIGSCNVMSLSKFKLPLALGAAVGQISVVNTFSHLHIPILLSVYRTLYGGVIGLFIGLFIFAVWKDIEKRLKAVRKEHNDE